MEKVFKYVVPAFGAVLIVVVIAGYLYLTSIPAATEEYEQVLSDEAYLKDNQQSYADCHYTTKSDADLSVSQTTNHYYNAGVSKDRLIALEAQFLAKYNDQCAPIIAGYENRYEQYQKHQVVLANAKQTALDKIIGKSPVVEKRHSNIMVLYEMYDPESLQYPVYDQARLLYTPDQYAEFLDQNL